ncbi:MAG: hypothetical protein A3K19_33425 [Lentisphaerae bacterium RIFOXYB12_FULL_65_16]|nr:MAG: hypothetical protein A3K18_05910 [Lentisphaerae bacterium RIFOXYA12_64_32]OGV86931.1 MAG: hypothetical protein A3K19_33425 [Lentisphaerae bacterium RIFOXYB12_FULL_65_16]
MPKTSQPLNVAIVGLGHLHPRSYMPLFKAVPQTRVTAVVEPDEKLREPFARDFALKAYADVDAMLAAEKIDIAAVFLPHADCPAAAAKLAKRGIHLMVEKPMASSAAGAGAIVKAAKAAGVKTTTGYCWRLHPGAAEFKRLIESGALGQIVAGEGRCAAGRLTRYIQGNSPWMLQKSRSGGGPMFNLGVHWIDLFRWMLSDEVVEVSGQNVKINKEYDIEDNSLAHLRFKSGPIVALDISYTVPDSFPHGRDLYLSVRGTKGVVSWAPAYEGQKDVIFVCSDDPKFAGAPRRHLQFELESVQGYSGFMGLNYVRAFADAILNNGTPPITAEDGHAALKVVEAIYKSAEEKRWAKV